MRLHFKPVAIALAIYALPTVSGLLPGLHTVMNAQVMAEEARKTQKVPAMRERVYSQLARAQKLADEQGPAAGMEVLDDIADRLDSMNSYERAMYWNFRAFIHYNAEQTADAISAFEQVVAEQAIPASLRLSTLYSLAQLSMMQEDYAQTLTYLDTWKQLNDKPIKANEHVLFAQVYYQNKDYTNTLTAVSAAVEIAEQADEYPKENWLILQRAAYYELKQPQQVAEVLEKMVRLFNKPQYWLQLAGMYGELELEDKQMAVMEAAYQAGFISKKADIMNLAQLYLFNQVPYKAASLLEQSMDSNVVPVTVDNLEMLAQAWVMAKEDEKAMPVLLQAAEIAEHGNFDAQLAELYLNNEKWKLAIASANQALKKGQLRREGNVHMVLGMSLFNERNFDASLASLKQAQGFSDTKVMAKQWSVYVRNEHDSYVQLAALNE